MRTIGMILMGLSRAEYKRGLATGASRRELVSVCHIMFNGNNTTDYIRALEAGATCADIRAFMRNIHSLSLDGSIRDFAMALEAGATLHSIGEFNGASRTYVPGVSHAYIEALKLRSNHQQIMEAVRSNIDFEGDYLKALRAGVTHEVVMRGLAADIAPSALEAVYRAGGNFDEILEAKALGIDPERFGRLRAAGETPENIQRLARA